MKNLDDMKNPKAFAVPTYVTRTGEVYVLRSFVDEKREPWFRAEDLRIMLELPEEGVMIGIPQSCRQDIQEIAPVPVRTYVNGYGLCVLLQRAEKHQRKRVREWIWERVLPELREAAAAGLVVPVHGDADAVSKAIRHELLHTAVAHLHDPEELKNLKDYTVYTKEDPAVNVERGEDGLQITITIRGGAPC